MPEKIKLHLVKTFIIPILTYPSYPLNTLPRSTLLILQKIQNKALRFVFNERYPYTHNTEELHRKANMEPLNIILHQRGKNTINELKTSIRDENYNRLIDNNDTREHTWFPKPYLKLTGPEPPPMYTG